METDDVVSYEEIEALWDEDPDPLEYRLDPQLRCGEGVEEFGFGSVSIILPGDAISGGAIEASEGRLESENEPAENELCNSAP
jgi:hypothetical protein